MVSFQCEVCNDVIKKPKLDAHRGQCPGAYYSCIDCQVTFNGIEYRSHTKCISEKEKYEKIGAGAIKNQAPKTNGKSTAAIKPKKKAQSAATSNDKKRKRDASSSDSDSSDSSEASSDQKVVSNAKKLITVTKESSESSSESESSEEEEEPKTKTVKAVAKQVKTKESSESDSDSSDEEEVKPKNVKAAAQKDESSDSDSDDSDDSESDAKDEPKPAKRAKVETNGNTEAKPKKAKKDKSYKGYSDNPRERTKQILDKILAARKDGISLHSLRKEVVKVAKVLRLEERQDALKAMPMKKGKKPKLQHKDRHLAGAKFFKNFKVIARDGEIKMEMM